ncbi:MAG: hypothetical protein GY810_03935 [Aureispira sp.]|nr:hypothetical protein [Aureispira sp.]
MTRTTLYLIILAMLTQCQIVAQPGALGPSLEFNFRLIYNGVPVTNMADYKIWTECNKDEFQDCLVSYQSPSYYKSSWTKLSFELEDHTPFPYTIFISYKGQDTMKITPVNNYGVESFFKPDYDYKGQKHTPIEFTKGEFILPLHTYTYQLVWEKFQPQQDSFGHILIEKHIACIHTTGDTVLTSRSVYSPDFRLLRYESFYNQGQKKQTIDNINRCAVYWHLNKIPRKLYVYNEEFLQTDQEGKPLKHSRYNGIRFKSQLIDSSTIIPPNYRADLFPAHPKIDPMSGGFLSYQDMISYKSSFIANKGAGLVYAIATNKASQTTINKFEQKLQSLIQGQKLLTLWHNWINYTLQYNNLSSIYTTKEILVKKSEMLNNQIQYSRQQFEKILQKESFETLFKIHHSIFK